MASNANYQSTQMSPLSSCVSSFYIDRIEDLLPEKKLVTEKLFKQKDQPLNGFGFGQGSSDFNMLSDDTPISKNLFAPSFPGLPLA